MIPSSTATFERPQRVKMALRDQHYYQPFDRQTKRLLYLRISNTSRKLEFDDVETAVAVDVEVLSAESIWPSLSLT